MADHASPQQTTEERKDITHQIEARDAIESVIMRRLHAGRIAGYTLPMAREIYESCHPLIAKAAKAEIEDLKAKNERLLDKIEGLDSDLRSAVDVLFRRGDDEAREWCRLNYPSWYPRAALGSQP